MWCVKLISTAAKNTNIVLLFRSQIGEKKVCGESYLPIVEMDKDRFSKVGTDAKRSCELKSCERKMERERCDREVLLRVQNISDALKNGLRNVRFLKNVRRSPQDEVIADRGIDVSARENHLRIGFYSAKFLEQLQAPQFRQSHIRQHEVNGISLRPEEGDRLLPVSCRDDRVPLIFKQSFQQVEKHDFVFDDEHSFLCAIHIP